MKTFKQFQKINEEKKNISVIGAPIHFKHVESHGEIPSAIHFKNSNDELNEGEAGNFDQWKDTNENSKLGHTSKAIVGKLTKGHDLTDDEVSNIKRYTETSRSLNNALKDRSKLKPQHNKISSSLDTVIDRHPVQHSYHTYSGLGFDPTDHTDENGKMLSPAYISTTHSKDVAHSFTSERRGIHHMARITLHPGNPAIHVSPYSDSPHEDETIIKKGVTLQHNGHEDYKDDRGRRYRVHKMTIAR